MSLFGRSEDPTADWPATGQALVLDLERQAVGPLRLGDAFNGARVFGRPLRVHGRGGDRTLEYETVQLEFKDGRLIAAKADLDGRKSVNVGDIPLTRRTQPLDALVWFGDAASDSTGGIDLRWMDFVRGEATLALEFDTQGLSCVQLYAEGYA